MRLKYQVNTCDNVFFFASYGDIALIEVFDVCFEGEGDDLKFALKAEIPVHPKGIEDLISALRKIQAELKPKAAKKKKVRKK